MLVQRAFGLFCLGLAASCAAVSREPATVYNPVAGAGECAANALDCCPPEPRDRISLCRLFAEMVDLSHLTRQPEPAYTSHMESSFDRRSQEATPGDEAWLANRDYAQLTPGEPLRLLDADGPGVVTRIWSANPSGTLRVYLDGSPRPVIEAPMRELLRGEIAPLRAPFASAAASGSNLYLPIPYQSHCTITVSSDAKKLFYQVNYRRYAKQVRVEAFDLATLNDARKLPSIVTRVLAGSADPKPNRGQHQRCTLVADSAGECSLTAASGGSLLRELRMRVQNPTSDALRQTMLRIQVDGSDTVRVPLGDFFGTGPGLQAVHALPVRVEPEDGSLVARWPMPFRHELHVALESTGGIPLAADVTLNFEPRSFDSRTLLFHAFWRPPEWHASEPSHVFTLATLNGSGFYVGTLLNVTNTDAAWWGEGDEQIWIDSEHFPSFFGTGTEDYFGYGWCSNERFSRPYVGQTRADPHANFGRVSLYRFHVLDAIYFRSSLRFDLEVNHWGDTPTPVAYDGIVYYYAQPGATAHPAPAAAALYRVPALDVDPPNGVPEAAYRCGGDK